MTSHPWADPSAPDGERTVGVTLHWRRWWHPGWSWIQIGWGWYEDHPLRPWPRVAVDQEGIWVMSWCGVLVDIAL